VALAAAYLPLRSRLAALLQAEARAGDVPSCVVRPQLTEGPYFVDENLLRSDIRSDPSDGSVRQGTPLRMDFVVSRLDGAGCLPFAGVVIDVWHCDAAGDYSDVLAPGSDTRGKKFLRGQQITDADGRAGFVTIYPAGIPAARCTCTGSSAPIRRARADSSASRRRRRDARRRPRRHRRA
jgi:protocatechuate 3,4-dioxygenase beta subunit